MLPPPPCAPRSSRAQLPSRQPHVRHHFLLSHLALRSRACASDSVSSTPSAPSHVLENALENCQHREHTGHTVHRDGESCQQRGVYRTQQTETFLRVAPLHSPATLRSSPSPAPPPFSCAAPFPSPAPIAHAPAAPIAHDSEEKDDTPPYVTERYAHAWHRARDPPLPPLPRHTALLLHPVHPSAGPSPEAERHCICESRQPGRAGRSAWSSLGSRPRTRRNSVSSVSVWSLSSASSGLDSADEDRARAGGWGTVRRS